MPITDFQRAIFEVIKSQRTLNSHLAGGTLINRDRSSARFSADIDIFHDIKDAVATSAINDSLALEKAGFAVLWLLQQPMFYRATVIKGANSIKLEWVYDSAFRFYPVQADTEFGYCLHKFDVATNKILAAANRNEVRDLIDIIQLNESWIPLGQLVWAACGKDPGLTPEFILDNIKRNSCVRQEQLDLELLAKPVSPRELKTKLLSAIEQALIFMASLPPDEIGGCYVDQSGDPMVLQTAEKSLSKVHYGSVGGAWPKIAE